MVAYGIGAAADLVGDGGAVCHGVWKRTGGGAGLPCAAAALL